MRILAISDLHVDYESNALWVNGLSNAEYQQDTLILAGDVSDCPDKLAACFEALARKFQSVFFVPGNHDLWVNSPSSCSLDKFEQVLDIARSQDIITSASKVGNYYIVPIFAWYDYSFGEPCPFILQAWSDFKRCRWPSEYHHPKKTLEYFLTKNTPINAPENVEIISFSHFLPRIDLMPEYIPPSKRVVYPVLGSIEIESLIRTLQPKKHIYGHSHVNRSIDIDGIHYINNAFGYPDEERIARKALIDIFAE